MKVAYSWLKRYIDTQLTPQQMADTLTRIGLEVEGLEEFSTIPGGLKGLVVGQVLTCTKHPNADRLSLTTVNIGTPEPLPIVCGAPNVAQGQKVAVATVGATLYPAAGDPIQIKKSKIRGEVSCGMLCAEDEIGLGSSHEGIMVLPDTATPGQPLAEFYNLQSDYVFEIGLTANRADAMSHYGVARDLAAYLYQTSDTRAKLPEVQLPELKPSTTAIQLGQITAERCLRYCGLTLRGVTVKPSPKWLQDALRSIGLHPINSVVDVTNFVLHEVGQPLHAFDCSAFTTGSVSVHTLPEGTPFTTLDGKQRTLSSEDLAICDGDTPLCLAGVFGGENSGVTDRTTDLFLESAVFDPTSIRKTARRHGLSTDASFRFERGVDPTSAPYALRRAASLILELAGGTLDGQMLDFYPAPASHQPVTLSLAALQSLLGLSIPEDRVLRILDGLEITHTPGAQGCYELQVPRYRVDVTRPADVAEEILRIHGYDNVPVPHAVTMALPTVQETPEPAMQRAVATSLVGAGFQEIMGLSLTAQAHFASLPSFPPESLVHLINPLSADLNVLRPTLLMGALDAVARSTARQQSDLMFFEFGNTFWQHTGAVDPANPLSNYSETPRLALTLTGYGSPELWHSEHRPHDIFSLRSYVEAILLQTATPLRKLVWEQAPEGLYQVGATLTRKGHAILHFGRVADALLERFGIKTPVYYAELNWRMLLTQWQEYTPHYTPLPRFPEVRRDLALLIDTSVRYADLQALAFSTEGKLLQRMNLFDVYEGKNIPSGKKSYAISFVLQDGGATLTDRAIDSAMQRLTAAFARECGATLR